MMAWLYAGEMLSSFSQRRQMQRPPLAAPCTLLLTISVRMPSCCPSLDMLLAALQLSHREGGGRHMEPKHVCRQTC